MLLASKGNETKIRESYKQMFKKLLDVNNKGVNSDGFQMGYIRQKIARVLKRFYKNLTRLSLPKPKGFVIILPLLDHHV